MKDAENKDFFASELLKDLKHANRRSFIIILVILTMWFATGCYLVYVLNDIQVVETETIQEITDVENIEGSTITNGE